MFFLLRTAFWLSVVLALLPTGGGEQAKINEANDKLNATEAVTAAGAAVSDMRQFCERQPDVCVVGSQAAVAFGQRAQAGAKMVYDFLSEKAAERIAAHRAAEKSAPEEKSAHEKSTSEKLRGEKAVLSATGSVKTIPARMVPVNRDSQHTLRPADLQPAWHAPAARKEAANAKEPT